MSGGADRQSRGGSEGRGRDEGGKKMGRGGGRTGSLRSLGETGTGRSNNPARQRPRNLRAMVQAQECGVDDEQEPR